MMTTITTKTGTQRRLSMPRVLLHVEGLVVLLAAVTLYAHQGYRWWPFALLLLTPDLVMIGYVFGNRVGSVAYNVMHSYSLPLMLAVSSLLASSPLGLQLALIWLAHIGMDRTVGYGLKYTTGFKDTHLGRV